MFTARGRGRETEVKGTLKREAKERAEGTTIKISGIGVTWAKGGKITCVWVLFSWALGEGKESKVGARGQNVERKGARATGGGRSL